MFRHGARALGGAGKPPYGLGGGRPSRGQSLKRFCSTSSTAPASKGMNPLLSAALTSASLTAVGDLVAQTFEQRESATKSYDPVRTGRLGAFGLCFYGPVQHFWYAFLNSALPVSRGMPLSQVILPFAGKVAANQLILGPITVSSVFAWNMIFTNTFSPEKYAEKWQRDTLRTLKKGWVFWVPAASVNFAIVPLRFQVLYMSTCSIVWTTILSAASASGAPAPKAAPPSVGAAAAGKKGGKGGKPPAVAASSKEQKKK